VADVRALVTGAGGFVGRHLTAHLGVCGDVVVGVDRECDVTQLVRVAEAVRAASPDVIYHLAALTHVGESWERPSEFTRVNVLGTLHVLEAAREHAPEAIIVVVSSADVYGVVAEADLPVTEASPPAPANPYSRSKLEAERLARAASAEGQRVLIVRPFNHVGPGQSSAFVVPALVERLLDARDDGREEIAVGDLSARRDFTDVRDVVRAYRLLVQHGTVGQTYHVASGQDVSISELAGRLIELIQPGARLHVDASLLRPVEVPVLRGSFDRLHDATGWEPSIALDRSLSDVIEDRRHQRGRA
jgi:GDP-4-dehydro-6-deoxy-D-mannose reductase